MDTGTRATVALVGVFFVILACDAWFNDHNWLATAYMAVCAYLPFQILVSKEDK